MFTTGKRHRELATFIINEAGDIRESAFPLVQEFLRSRVIIDDETGCWIWQGNRTMGRRWVNYGVIPSLNKQVAHRVSYTVFVGPIPPGKFVCHRCDVGLCINPEHLWTGTHQENMQDMVAKGRANFGVRQSKTHCKHGHEFTPENTFISQGNRYCRECARRQSRERARRIAPEIARLRTKAWRAANRERFNANARSYAKKRRRQTMGLLEDDPQDLRGKWKRKTVDQA